MRLNYSMAAAVLPTRRSRRRVARLLLIQRDPRRATANPQSTRWHRQRIRGPAALLSAHAPPAPSKFLPSHAVDVEETRRLLARVVGQNDPAV